MTRLIAAYPCLGKSTLHTLNRGSTLDMEVYESRATRDMTPDQEDAYFTGVAMMIDAIASCGSYRHVFISEDDRLINKLLELGYADQLTLVFPDLDTGLESYHNRILERNDEAWWQRVIVPELDELPHRIKRYRSLGLDVIQTGENQYLEDVIDFGAGFATPGGDRHG